MLDRRQFLGGAVLLVGCSAKVIPQDVADGGPTGIPGCQGLVVMSTVDADHSHLVCVLNADIASPQPGGAFYTTTDDSNHTHSVVMTQAFLQSLQMGGLVNVTTSSALDPVNGFMHTHQFSIVKM